LSTAKEGRGAIVTAGAQRGRKRKVVCFLMGKKKKEGGEAFGLPPNEDNYQEKGGGEKGKKGIAEVGSTARVFRGGGGGWGISKQSKGRKGRKRKKKKKKCPRKGEKRGNQKTALQNHFSLCFRGGKKRKLRGGRWKNRFLFLWGKGGGGETVPCRSQPITRGEKEEGLRDRLKERKNKRKFRLIEP